MSYRGKSKGNHGNLRRAKRVQARRSDWAKHIDERLKAPKAENVEQWLSAPNRYDLPNVDTNKPQKAKPESMRVSKEFFWENDNANKIFDRLVNKDYVNDNPANKKAFNKIIMILDKAKIPYYDAQDFGVQVLKSDMGRAEKLTEKYQKILWETSH